MAHAICALNSVSRWAVTGTPIQNRLSDLSTLLKFIRVYPYTDPKCFDSDISQLWESGKDEEAVKRLKRLSACLLLRRPKGIMNLPRRDMKCPVDFTREERAAYDEMREQAIIRIDEALHKESGALRAGGYLNILQLIQSLRLFCNLGLHYHARHDGFLESRTETDDWASVAQQAFNVWRETGPIICLQCSSSLEMAETVLDDSTAIQQSPLIFRCLKFVCGDCTRKLGRAGSTAACGHSPSCPVASVSTSTSVLEETLDMISTQTKILSIGLPSKVEALVSDLKTLHPDVKWYFSSATSLSK